MALSMKTILVYRPEADDATLDNPNVHHAEDPFSGIEVIGSIIGQDPQQWIDAFCLAVKADTSKWKFYIAGEPSTPEDMIDVVASSVVPTSVIVELFRTTEHALRDGDSQIMASRLSSMRDTLALIAPEACAMASHDDPPDMVLDRNEWVPRGS